MIGRLGVLAGEGRWEVELKLRTFSVRHGGESFGIQR